MLKLDVVQNISACELLFTNRWGFQISPRSKVLKTLSAIRAYTNMALVVMEWVLLVKEILLKLRIWCLQKRWMLIALFHWKSILYLVENGDHTWLQNCLHFAEGSCSGENNNHFDGTFWLYYFKQICLIELGHSFKSLSWISFFNVWILAFSSALAISVWPADFQYCCCYADDI